MQLGTQGGSQTREGRNQTVAGTPFSWEEHQDIVQVWVVRAAAKSSDLGRHEHKSEDTVVWQSAFQTEEQNQGAQPPPLTLSDLASPHPLCQVAEHIICKPENWHYRNTFTLSKGCTFQLIPG